MTTFLPLIADAPACNMPAAGDSLDEPIVVQLRTADGQEIFMPLTLAAAQALAQLLLRGDDEVVAASCAQTGPTAARLAR